MSLRGRLEKVRSLAGSVPNEESVKIQIVLPILRELGWDDTDPQSVMLELDVGAQRKRRIDIALLAPQRPVVLIETKAPGKPLKDHVAQMLEYAFHEGVDIAVLSDGFIWWCYLPLEKGKPEARRFAELNLIADPLDRATEELQDFLRHDRVISGEAEEQATAALLRAKIPGVWQRMQEAPDHDFLNLIQHRVYEESRLRPTHEQISDILGFGPTPPPPTPPSPGRYRLLLWGEQREFNYWHELPVAVATLIDLHHSERLPEILKIRGAKRVYFSTDPASESPPMRVPTPLGVAGYFYDRDQNRDTFIRTAQRMVAAVGFDPDEVKISRVSAS